MAKQQSSAAAARARSMFSPTSTAIILAAASTRPPLEESLPVKSILLALALLLSPLPVLAEEDTLATSAGSVQASIANNLMAHPNIYTPLGSQTWTQTGTAQVPGAEGNPAVDVPQYEQRYEYKNAVRSLTFDQDNFPALVLSVFWRPFTTRGAQASAVAISSSRRLP